MIILPKLPWLWLVLSYPGHASLVTPVDSESSLVIIEWAQVTNETTLLLKSFT